MKVSFENPDKINGLMTLVVEEADYKNEVEKTLKDYLRSDVPGFRPGQAPMGIIKRQFGASVDGGHQQARWPGDLQVCTGQQYPDARPASPIREAGAS